MTELDRAALDRVLPATAGSPDWDDVLGRSREHEKRRRLITLAVVAVTAVLATASAFAVRAIVFDGGGVTALPREGATPSAPATGRLVLSYHGRPLGGPPVVQVWVYADGRIVRRTFDGPAGVGGIRTGFIERRLTHEGVELLRSKIVSTGLFDRDRAVRTTNANFFGSMQVQTGGRLVTLGWGAHPFFWQHVKRAALLTDDQAQAAVARLIDWILDPASALPTRAWESREPRAYVPSKYAICYMRARVPANVLEYVDRPSRALRALPAAARDLLRGKIRAFSSSGFRTQCSELTIEDARALYVILRESGYEQDPFATGKTPFATGPAPGPDNVVNNIRFQAPRPNQTLFIAFEPILPHGSWELMPG
ncbi:MAG: hypothetical protein ACRDPV_13645 [Gaiellaceae bacterium]